MATTLLRLMPTDKFSILGICDDDSTLAEAQSFPGSEPGWYKIRNAARHAAWLRKRNAAGDRSPAPQTKNWEFVEHVERKQELTLNGVRATSLVCWPALFGHCSCGDVKKKAHCFEGCCGGGLNMALGHKKRRCRKLPSMCRNRHPTEEEAISALEAWHISSGRGRPVLGRAAAPTLRVISGASAATAASGSDGGGTTGDHRQSAFQLRGQRCTVPPETLIGRLARRPSAYVGRLLREPFFAELVADDRLRQLLCMRKAHKEVTEAYGVADRVLKVAQRLASRPQRGGGAVIDPVTGAGLVVLDMCSGRGVPAVLVSFLLPRARVVMLDADGGMDLSHVASRPNLQFEAFDLFSADAARNLEAIVADGGACIAYGVHLCGALSPRLATLACRLPCVDALVLCPCCLRGSLGRDVQREAAHAGGGEAAHYPLLVETVAGLCRRQAFRGRGQPVNKPQQHREGGEGLPSTALAPMVRGEVTVEFDSSVLSPKNGFITVVKSDLWPSFSEISG